MSDPRSLVSSSLAIETVPDLTEHATGAPRDPLLLEHREARRRRDAAPLNSAAYRQASIDIARIEVEIAALERVDPPTQT